MAYNNGKIEPPVSINDVQRAIHVYSGDLATLCKSTNINKWARYKPERADGPTPLIHGDSTSGQRSRFANHFGLDVPYCQMDIMNSMVWELLDDPWVNEKWNYLQPQGDMSGSGGVKEFYRLTDFAKLPNDTTDPYLNNTNIKGYNDDAVVPFKSYISSGGVTEKVDQSDYKTYFEVNVLGVTDNKLVLTFINNTGDDLHLQDFITINSGAGDNDVAWRPVVQIFREYTQAGGTPWYERDNISGDDMQFAGDAITSVQGGSWTVEIPINDSRFHQDEYYHMCIGVGCCKKDMSAWQDDNNSLFIMPYEEQDIMDGQYPFYCRLKVVSHFDRHLTFINMVYGIEPTVISFNGQSTVNIPANASGTAVFEMTVDKSQSQALKFVGQYGTLTPQEQSQGYTTMKICLVNQLTGDEYYLSPVQGLGTSQRSTSKSDAYVPSGSGKITLYGTTYNSTTGNAMDVGQLGTNAYWHFQVKVYIGASDQENASGISIHKLSN